jgi:hypothetical protein
MFPTNTDTLVVALFVVWTLTILWAPAQLRRKLLHTRWGKAVVLCIVLLFACHHTVYGVVAVLTLVVVSGPDTLEGMTTKGGALPSRKPKEQQPITTVRIVDLLHLQDTVQPKASSSMLPVAP